MKILSRKLGGEKAFFLFDEKSRRSDFFLPFFKWTSARIFVGEKNGPRVVGRR